MVHGTASDYCQVRRGGRLADSCPYATVGVWAGPDRQTELAPSQPDVQDAKAGVPRRGLGLRQPGGCDAAWM